MERFNRAERRAQIARLKKNRKTYWGRYQPTAPAMTPRALGKVVQYPRYCSCALCTGGLRHLGNSLRALKATNRSQLELLHSESLD